jgi:hypothetical protein
MKKFVLVLAFIFALLGVGVINANAQAISNDFRLTAGVVNVENQTLFTGNAEVRKGFNDKFGLVNTVTTITDNDFTLVQNQAIVRFAPVKNVFVAGGINVGKIQGFDPFIAPVVQAGLNFDLGRVNIEPFVALQTPDLASDNPNRSLSGNLTAKLRVTKSFGLVGNASVSSTKPDNDFFEGAAIRTVTGGVYFSF